MAYMDLEKAYDRIDRNALCKTVSIFDMGGKLLKAVNFYQEIKACM